MNNETYSKQATIIGNLLAMLIDKLQNIPDEKFYSDDWGDILHESLETTLDRLNKLKE